MEITPAVITPLDNHMGLDIARSLGQRGIPVYGIDPDPETAGRLSKYIKLVVSPDLKNSELEYINFLVEWGKSQVNPPVLFPVSDATSQLCSRERQKLLTHFKFVIPDHITLERLSSKQGLACAAAEFGIPAPQTITPLDLQAVKTNASKLSYPVILKPVESEYWHRDEIARLLRKNALSGRVKVVFCKNASELLQAYQNIARYDPRMIIQESIPGPDENLFYISFYLNRKSEPLAIFAGQKLRVLPVGFGSASYVRSIQDPELEEVALRLLLNVRYQGLGGIEFKKDARDGQYKLIEFNTRFGMWDGLGVRCGVDTPYIAYQDTLGECPRPQLTYRKNIIWVDWQRDIRAFWAYQQQGKLTFGQWLNSLRGEKMWAIYSRDDWRPGIMFSYHLIRLLWTRLKRRTRPSLFATKAITR
jgi:predicted ATP-grasp superfamily ATP-dependent carboligase